jgi:hypothetical protein
MKVKNLNNTANKDCNCASWLEHWQKGSGKVVGICAVVDCKGDDLVGAHVQKVDGYDRAHYIVPMCKACNNKRGAVLDVVDGFAPFVSANVSLTCG